MNWNNGERLKREEALEEASSSIGEESKLCNGVVGSPDTSLAADGAASGSESGYDERPIKRSTQSAKKVKPGIPSPSHARIYAIPTPPHIGILAHPSHMGTPLSHHTCPSYTIS